MKWETDTSAETIEDATLILGNLAMVRVLPDSVLRSFFSDLAVHMSDEPGNPGASVVPYVPIAAVGWPLFHQDDAVAMNDVSWSERLLFPPYRFVSWQIRTRPLTLQL